MTKDAQEVELEVLAESQNISTISVALVEKNQIPNL